MPSRLSRTPFYAAGSLTTPDSSHPDLTIVAVSHDRPGELPSGGEANLWGALGERLRSPWHAVEAVIHLGGQVWISGWMDHSRHVASFGRSSSSTPAMWCLRT